MRPLITVIITAFLLLPIPAFATIQTVTATVQQPFGGSQSPDDARIAGIARAKREALERAGTYIESATIIKNSRFDSDEILALTAGVAKSEVIKQRNYTDGDAFGIEITVKVEIDTEVLEKSLKSLVEDRNHLKDLMAAREREKKLLARITELEKENQLKGKTRQQEETLKEEFQEASQGLTAMGWFYNALILWDGKKYTDPNKAIEYLTQAIRLDPNNSAAYDNRGSAYFSLNQLDRAITDYDQAIRLDPNDALAYYNRGNTYSDLRQLDRAIADYDQAIRLDSNYAQTYNNRGNAYSSLKQFDRAIADYDQAIRIEPNLALAYNNRGSTYNDLKQFHRAIADFDQAIRLEPNLARAYSNRGIAYALLTQIDHAFADYNQAIRIDPSDAKAYYNRGLAYANLNQFDRAIADFDQAIRHNPNYALAYYNRGSIYSDLNQFDRAIADYDQAIRIDPNDAQAYNNRGIAYLMLNKVQNGCADLKKACTLGVCGGYEYARREKMCR